MSHLNADDRSREALELTTREVGDCTVHYNLQLEQLNVLIFNLALVLG